MTKLYLVRHGETVDNVNRIMQGQTQGELTAVGVSQAEALAEQMAGLPLDAIVASDLKRAVDTAAATARRRGMEVLTTPLLRERDWGGFTGRFIPDLKDEKWPDDVETMAQLMARSRDFIDFVLTHYAGCCVVAVGHGIINKAIQAVYHKKPIHEVPRMGNAEVRTLIFSH